MPVHLRMASSFLFVAVNGSLPVKSLPGVSKRQLEATNRHDCPRIRKSWPSDNGIQIAFRFDMTFREITELVRESFNEWNKDNVPRLGAALAYYTVLSMAPLLVVVVAVAGLAFGEEAARGQIVWQIQGLVGHQIAEAIQEILQGAQGPGKGLIATIAGVVTLALGASLVVSELRSS